MCWYAANPDIKWFSGSDITEPLLGITCDRVKGTTDTAQGSATYKLFKLLREIEIPVLP